MSCMHDIPARMAWTPATVKYGHGACQRLVGVRVDHAIQQWQRAASGPTRRAERLLPEAHSKRFGSGLLRVIVQRVHDEHDAMLRGAVPRLVHLGVVEHQHLAGFPASRLPAHP